MNREILFRAKVADEPNEWVYGYLINDNMIYQPTKTKKSKVCGNGSFFVNKETVGQYIGFENKNGEKLFEGDIVTDGDKNYIVSYHRGSFILNEINKAYYRNFINCYMDYIKGLKIIGNRFDNSELLEKK